MKDNFQSVQTGWELNRRTHFDEIVANYDKIRPEYPRELFNDIFKYSNSTKGKNALEIGAGTGKATKPFLEAGYSVTAVEVGENMAEFLKERYREYNNFNVILSDFENASLEENCYDLIYAASAFHWVNPEVGCPKTFRLLKNGGVVALFRYNAIPSIGEKVYEDIQTVYEKHYYSYYKSNKRPVKKSHADFCTPAEILHSFGFKSLSEYGFSDISMTFYDITRSFSADEFVAIRDTFSDHRGLPEDNRNALYAELKEAILKNGGRFDERYTFQLYMGRK